MIVIIGAFLLLSLPALAEDKQVYLESITDMPLMAGLAEIDGNSFTFDKLDGRLIETVASGKIDSDTIEAYYRQTLPQLGWQEKAANVWARDHEKISITTQKQNDTTYVRFTLSPEKP